MANKIIKFLIKATLIAWLILFVISRIFSVRLDSFFLPIVLLVIGFMLVKRWLPFLYALMKRAASWLLKTTANLLWPEAERKGGASVRQPRMRWRP